MSNVNDVGDRATKRIRWIARIWGTMIVAFTLLMLIGYAWNWATGGLADPHAVEDYPPIENLPPIFMLLSILGLCIAWRWERLGGVIAIAFQVAVLAVLLTQRLLTQDFTRSAIPYILSVIVVIPGMLFLVCWRRSR